MNGREIDPGKKAKRACKFLLRHRDTRDGWLTLISRVHVARHMMIRWIEFKYEWTREATTISDKVVVQIWNFMFLAPRQQHLSQSFVVVRLAWSGRKESFSQRRPRYATYYYSFAHCWRMVAESGAIYIGGNSLCVSSNIVCRQRDFVVG